MFKKQMSFWFDNKQEVLQLNVLGIQPEMLSGIVGNVSYKLWVELPTTSQYSL